MLLVQLHVSYGNHAYTVVFGLTIVSILLRLQRDSERDEKCMYSQY